MKVSDFIVQFLKSKNVKYVFGYQGGNITHLVDSISLIKGIDYVQTYHEQAASFAANSYAESNNTIGVAISSSGPGAANMINGIANSYYDSIPCMFITGQISTYGLKDKVSIRQKSFQEMDIVEIVKPITKYAVRILEPEKIAYYLEKAYAIAESGRKGSVLLDIPHNIQSADVNIAKLEHYKEPICKSEDNINGQIEGVVELIHASKRPVILLGGGAKSIKDNLELKNKLTKLNIPVVASLRGLDVISHSEPCFCGFIGAYGNRYANFAIAKSDLLIVLGSRLDPQQTGGYIQYFARNATIVHVDIDEIELNRAINEQVSIKADIEYFLNRLFAIISNYQIKPTETWLQEIYTWKIRYSSNKFNGNVLLPNKIINELSQYFDTDADICVDVGQNQMWTAQSIFLDEGKSLFSSGGLGSMGYALPATIGCYYANHQKQLICIAGDGGIQMNIQELQTIVRDKIPAKIFIFNNRSLGMIRILQEKILDSRTFGSVEGFDSPDYEKIANAYGLKYLKIENGLGELDIKEEMNNSEPYIFEVIIDADSQIVPEPVARKAVDDQAPLLSRNEYEMIFKEKIDEEN